MLLLEQLALDGSYFQAIRGHYGRGMSVTRLRERWELLAPPNWVPETRAPPTGAEIRGLPVWIRCGQRN